MRHYDKRLVTFLLCFLAIAFAGCSLLEVSVSSGEPLPKEDAQLRTFTRGFYYTFQKQAVELADSVIRSSDDFNVKSRAIRWKIQTTRAVASAALESSPELAAVELWTFCKALNRSLNSGPDSLLFSEYTSVVADRVDEMEKRYVSQLSHILPDERINLMKEFVETRDYSSFSKENQFTCDVSLEWMEYLKKKGMEYKTAAGSISEAITDVGGKMEGYTNQFSNDLSWGKELLDLEIRQDSIYEKIDGQLKALNEEFERVTMVMQDFPEISDQLLSNMNVYADQILDSFNSLVLQTFSGIDRQREELQKYISKERVALLNDVHRAVNDSVENVLDWLPLFLGKMLGYILLFLIILLGIPFYIGFRFGKMHTRRKSKKLEKADK